MTDDEKAEHDDEYEKLLALYIALLRNIKTEAAKEALFDLSRQRALFLIGHAIKGLGLTSEQATQLLYSKDDNSLTQHDKDIRDRLVAAVNNLVEFGVCEEYQLYKEALQQLVDNDDADLDMEDYEDLEGLCRKYNDIYAAIENGDVAYAASIAAWWTRFSSADYLVYWTQNDAKVRPWHMALQGYAATVEEFPSWIIPPIEWNCRCYLEPLEVNVRGDASFVKEVRAKASKIQKPTQIDDVFSESLAKCGRIFGASHSYFIVDENDTEMIGEFVNRIKEEVYG